MKNKKPLTAVFILACLKIRSRNGEVINSTRNETNLLAKCFLLPILSTSIIFTCFWIDLVCVLATTGNTSAVAGYARKFKGLDSREITSLPEIEKVIYMARLFKKSDAHPKTHLHTVKVYNARPSQFCLFRFLLFLNHSVVFTCSKVINAFKR